MPEHIATNDDLAKIVDTSDEWISLVPSDPIIMCKSPDALVSASVPVSPFINDISAACSGFLFALNTAHSFIQSGCYETILVIGVDCMSKVVDWSDS